MKYLKAVSFILSTIILILFYPDTPSAIAQNVKSNGSETDKIEVLNFGTFHMGFTNDANTTEFDENDRKNQERIHQVAERLAEFDPTVIIVEHQPQENEAIQEEYHQYRE
ncbi:MAG: hypothetical protein R6V27_07685, partial [Balneolaceae bacterium]